MPIDQSGADEEWNRLRIGSDPTRRTVKRKRHASSDRIKWLDRKLGPLLSRIAGTFAAVGGVAAAWSVMTLAEFSFASHWPVLGFSALMLFIASVCFRARPSLLDMLSEVPGDSVPSPHGQDRERPNSGVRRG